MKPALLTLPAGAACIIALASCTSKTAILPAPDVRLRSVEGERLPIGRGQTVVVVSYLLTRADQARNAKFPGGAVRPLPDRTLADPNVALVQILNGGDRIPQMFAKRIGKALIPKLKKEREYLAQEIAGAGFGNAERLAKRSLYYAVDLNGELTRRLGLEHGRDGIATAVVDGSGNVVFSRAGGVRADELVAVLGRAREKGVTSHAAPPVRSPSVSVVSRRRVLESLTSSDSPPRGSLPEPLSAVNPQPEPQPQPTPPQQQASLKAGDTAPSKIKENDRALLSSLVSTGVPVMFTGRRAIFRSSKAPKFASPPGPFEDAAIEAEVRGRLEANPGLAGRKITVRSRGGIVELGGGLDDIGIAAAAINIVLTTFGVIEVWAELK